MARNLLKELLEDPLKYKRFVAEAERQSRRRRRLSGFTFGVSTNTTVDEEPDVDTDAQAIIDECTTAPNAAAQTAINDFVVGLKAIDLGSSKTGWTEIEELFVALRTGTAADALINWKAPTGSKFTLVESPTFSQNAGSLGQYARTAGGNVDGVLGIANLADMTKYLQDDAHASVYVIAGTGEEAAGVLGTEAAATGLNIRPRIATDVCRFFVNTATATNVANTDGTGFYLAVRTASNACAIFRNGTSLGTGTAASATRAAAPWQLIRTATVNDSTRTVCAASVGSGLLSSVQDDIYTLVAALIAALQAAT